jgi:hypothetical protein
MRLILVLIILMTYVSSYSVSWELKVIYPDREEKNYSPTTKSLQVFLPKSPWRCLVTEVEDKSTTTVVGTRDFHSRWINCIYKDQNVAVHLGCLDGDIIPSNTGIQLSTNNKHSSTNHILILRCLP